VDDAVNLDNGEAWMSVAGSGIAYTKDNGFNWEKRKIPEVKQRYAAIFFNGKREGIIGSLWNSLAITRDNCKSWTLLPTPLDQKAYQKTNLGSRPEFRRAALFKEYYLVVQEGMVFYSPQDSIRWRRLDGYIDFYTDADNSALYLRNEKGEIVRADNDLKLVYAYGKAEGLNDAKCKNSSLFVLANSKIYCYRPDGRSTASLVSSTDLTVVKPEVFGYTTLGNMGRWGNKVFFQNGFEGGWRHQFTLPESAKDGVLSVSDGKWIISRSATDSLLYFDLTGTIIKRSSVDSEVEAFRQAGIAKLIFSKGSSGCFHSYQGKAVYAAEDRSFVAQTPEPVLTGTKKKIAVLHSGREEIQANDVALFTAKLQDLFDTSKTVSISDLSFAERDYEQCRNDIRDFQTGLSKGKQVGKSFSFEKNNLNFERLLYLVDTISHLSSGTLHQLLTAGNGIWSTTTNWIKLELVNGRDDVLSIESHFYEAPPYYFPWRVTLNGNKVLSSNTEINRFIEKVYPTFLAKTNKIRVLHQLVKALY
jgi:hypothetical protein